MIIFLATFVRIFLLAWQTQNIMGGHYKWAVATTAPLALVEVAFVIEVVKSEWYTLPWVFLGGSLGVTSSMYFHRLWVRGNGK